MKLHYLEGKEVEVGDLVGTIWGARAAVIQIYEHSGRILLRIGSQCLGVNADEIGAFWQGTPDVMFRAYQMFYASKVESVMLGVRQVKHETERMKKAGRETDQRKVQVANFIDNGCQHTLLVSNEEVDAILAGLRLLAREVAAGLVAFKDDDDIGAIWTCDGDHDGLVPDEIHALADRLREDVK